MDWTNLWTPAQALCLPDLWVQQDFDRALECFADLFETGASKLEVANRLTACKIPTHLRGFWIAAALSHINPAARIVFFSGAPTAIEGAEAGAFMQFKTRPVQISRKEDAQYPNSIDKKLSQELAILQAAALDYSEEAYRWFITSVIFPTLLGIEPVADNCGPLHRVDESTRLWMLDPKFFFGQWDRWCEAKTLLPELKMFLRLEPFHLSASQMRALVSVRHALKHILRHGMDLSVLIEAETTSYQVGQAGWALVQAISKARDGYSLEGIRGALTLCDRIAESSSSQLWDLCKEIKIRYNSVNSRYCCDSNVEHRPGSSDCASGEGSDPAVPFDVQFLRRACEALIDNAKRHPGVSGREPSISMQVEDSSKYLTITYRDDSSGFESEDTFKGAIDRSIAENGTHALDRGVPLALAFGFHFPLTSLEVKFNYGGWLQIYPTHSKSTEEAAGGFGVRWKFQYPVVSANDE
jgi:hypothetical protein